MISMMPQYIKFLNSGKYISNETKIRSEHPVFEQTLRKSIKRDYDANLCYRNINFKSGIPQSIKEKISDEFSITFVENEEGYVIDIQESDINIYSNSERGLFYGCITLLQVMEKQYVKSMLAYDYPVCPVRGLKVYLPPEDEIEYFKQFVDMICFYRYNTIMIEVGGAMEYKKHPEINEGWVEYCREMYEYSGKTTEIQDNTYDWKKNSIHAENGGGSYLGQDVVRELVKYCKDRMLNVIAEVPSLSHCDYLLINHHELAERQNDPYPDTYCPSDPKSYELLFDVLEEVNDVFKPEIINIGHDEYYSISICDKCKEKKPAEIFVNDVVKIRDFLTGLGVKTMIWGDKLLDAYLEGYGHCGGAARKLYSPKTGEYTETIPPTYSSMEFFPKDVKILHWYWGIDARYENEYLERDMDVTYGNFRGEEFVNWQKRINKGVHGGIISNWSTLREENLQRNGILYSIAYSSNMFWNKDFSDSYYEETRDKTFESLFTYKYKDMIEHAEENAAFGRTSLVEITHTTDCRMEYKQFVDGTFIDFDEYKIGDYILQYDNGTEVKIPVVYGYNISSRDVQWDKQITGSRVDGVEGRFAVDRLLIEVSSTAYPIRIDSFTYYKFLFANPNPDMKIKGIYVESRNKGKYNIFVKSIKFM